MKKKNLKQDNIILDKIEFKAKKGHQKKEGVFTILKRYNYSEIYNINPNVTNQSPGLYKARTGISTNKNRIHSGKGEFSNVSHWDGQIETGTQDSSDTINHQSSVYILLVIKYLYKNKIVCA